MATASTASIPPAAPPAATPAVVKAIVENHDGEIQVESQPGQGSTFRVTLPNS